MGLSERVARIETAARKRRGMDFMLILPDDFPTPVESDTPGVFRGCREPDYEPGDYVAECGGGPGRVITAAEAKRLNAERREPQEGEANEGCNFTTLDDHD